MNKTYLIVCEHAFAVYSALPLVLKIRKAEEQLTVFTPLSLKTGSMAYLSLFDEEWNSLDGYHSGLGNRLTKWFEMIFVPLDFSMTYRLRKNITTKASERYLARKTSWLKFKPEVINRNYVKLFTFLSNVGIIKGLPSGYSDYIAFTKLQSPYLLAPYSGSLTLVMESWDHPMKEPYFAFPAKHIVWNDALKKEVHAFQYLPRVESALAGKFRYIRERKLKSRKELVGSLPEPYCSDFDRLPDDGYLVYPLCTSSRYFAFQGEYRFVEDLAKILSKTGLVLYLRPYPLAPEEDLIELKKIPNVVIGQGAGATTGDDVLDENAQTHKYLLIDNARLVINVGTTFAIDAALCGTEVLQMKLDDPTLKERYGNFIQYSQGLHIVEHFWTTNSISFQPGMSELLSNENFEAARRFSDELALWMEPTIKV